MKSRGILVAFRADDPRLVPELAVLRSRCRRCSKACLLSPASSSAAIDEQLDVVCPQCLTRAEVAAMGQQQVVVTAAQIAECARYLEGRTS